MTPKVSVVIPTHRGERFIRNCLASLYRSTLRDFETILVDDCSTDGTVRIVEEEFPQVRIVRMSRNVGFPRAVNAGMRATDAEYIVLLNDDTVVDPRWLEELVTCASANPRAAMVGSKIYFPDGKTIQHAGGMLFPNGHGRHLGFGELDTGQCDAQRTVDYCTGAALLITRGLIERVGYLYPRSRGYFEEIDLAWKARRLGYEIVYNPRAVVIHHESQTYGRGFRYLFTLNCARLKFIALNFTARETIDGALYEARFFSTPYGRSMRGPMLAAYAATLPILPLVLWDRFRIARRMKAHAAGLAALRAPADTTPSMNTASGRPLRVAFLSFEYPPETGFGGIGTYTRDLARALVREGVEVHLIAGASTPKNATTVEDGVRVTRIKYGPPYRRLLDWLWDHGLPSTSRRFENAVSMYRCFKKLHAARPFDVVEMPDCGGEGALVSSLMRGVKKVVTFHGPMLFAGHFYDNSRSDLALTNFIERRTIMGADAYVTLSRFLAARVREAYRLKKPIEVIPLGLDPAEFDTVTPRDVRSKFGIPPDARLVLFTGRVEERKGAHLLGEIIPPVARACPDVVFAVVGRISYHALHRGIVESLKAQGLERHALFTDHADYADMVNFMRTADVFLLPSLWENCPKTLLDAMGMGKAIVAAAAGGVPEMIEDRRSGLLAESGNARDLAAKIVEMLQSPDLARRCGEEARRAARERFSQREAVRRKMEIYRRS